MTVITSGKAALFTLTLMVMTAYTALCAPPHLWPDQVEGAPANTALHMKGEARTHFEEPRPLFMQVKTVSIRYGSPILINGELVAYPIAEGTLAFRTVFGVRVGGVTLERDGPRGEDGSYLGWDYRRDLLMWLLFLLTEAALGALLLWQVWNMP